VVSSVVLLTVAEAAGIGDGGRGKRRELPRER